MELQEREAQPTAVVRRRLTWEDFRTTWNGLLDQVYDRVRSGTVVQDGHNVMVYRDVADGRVDVEVGVEAAGPFPAAGDVVPSELPGGRVVVAVHHGSYHELRTTHDAVHRWCTAQGLALAGPRWEVYGDWHEDVARLETEVVYLLA
jgi:effector-binding domain-containing protein